MASLQQMRSSNAQIATSLGPGLVAVFAGATSGVGETTAKQFAKHATKPRIYFLGRSKTAGERIRAELQELNKEGEYIFISADVSLMRSVDEVCRDIRKKETSINLLFLSTGELVTGDDTEEGLTRASAVAYYARTRFIIDLLPLLQKATGLRRVVSVAAATKEGPLFIDDLQARNVPLTSLRGHASSLTTLTLEAIAKKKAPEVSFVHDFPGAVKSNLGRSASSPLSIRIFSFLFRTLAPLFAIPTDEAGERQLFLATSARYPPPASDSDTTSAAAGVPLPDGVMVARGSDGKTGSGVYSVNFDGETASAQVEELLAKMRNEGVVDKVWADTAGHFVRITGAEDLV